MSNWIQVPIISSSTHPLDEGNGDISLYADEVLPPLDENFERPLYSESDSDVEVDDGRQFFNQRVPRLDPDYSLDNFY